MAVLRYILTALTLIALALIPRVATAAARVSTGNIADKPSRGTLRAALMILERGDATKAKTMARMLAKQDVQTAALYELQWIATRIEARAGRISVAADTDSVLRWKPSPEIWRDEWNSYEAMPRSAKTDARLQPTSEELAALREVLLNSKIYADSVSADLEKALLTLLYNDFASGTETDIRSRPAIADFIARAVENGVERCQWRARALVMEKASMPAMEAWKRDCSKCEGKFCERVDLELADNYSEKNRYVAALEIYQRLSRSSPTPSMAVQYRVVALQILSGKPIENVLRAAAPVLSDEEDTSVTSAQRASIRSYVCGEVASVGRSTLNALLRKIYTQRAWVQQARGWILSCGIEESRRIAGVAELPGVSQIERDSIRLALQVRQTQQKSRDARAQREMDKASTVDKTLRSKPKDLGGVLKVPVLFPFPEVEMKPAPFEIGKGFSNLVDEG